MEVWNTMIFVGEQGETLEQAVSDKLHSILSRIETAGGARAMQAGTSSAVKQHLSDRFPGSAHWNSAGNVTPGQATAAQGEVDAETLVNVAGASRAYHDVTIEPRVHKFLAIPIHRAAFGKSPSEFSDLFPIKKKDGTELLAQKQGSALAFLFTLKRRVFQGQDDSIMPSDESIASSIGSYLANLIQAEGSTI